MESSRNFGELSSEEQFTIVQRIGQALKDSELLNIKPKVIDSVFSQINMSSVKRQTVLNVAGKASFDNQQKVKEFLKAALPVIANLDADSVQLDVTTKAQAGSEYLEMTEVVRVFEEEVATISHKPGQVLLVDFWATWCPPCQAPMAHNQHMLETHGSKWGDKVRIVGVSIDKVVPDLAKHIKDKKWELVEHFHIGGSSAYDDYGVEGVPEVVLVDMNGKIAFCGSPTSRNLEQDIETLLKGEALTGVAKPSEDDSDEDDDWEEETGQDLDIAAITTEIRSFFVKVNGLVQQPDVRQYAKDLMRDFIILKRESIWDQSSNKFQTTYKNTVILAGPRESVKGTKAYVQAFLRQFGGTFKIDWKVQPM